MPRCLFPLFHLLCGVSLLVSCGTGRVLKTGRGPEDLVRVQLSGGDAVLAGTVERGLLARMLPWKQGRLEFFRPGHDKGFHTVYAASRHADKDRSGFSPVGMDVVYVSKAPRFKNKQLVYVINEASAQRGTRTVEVFEVTPAGAIQHRGALTPSTCIALGNSIAAASDGCVYVSNFSLLPGRADEPVSLQQKGGCGAKVKNTIACFRPAKDSALEGTWTTVASGFDGVNGMALAADERHLLVNSLHARKIHAFTRTPGGGTLGMVSLVAEKLPFSPDNLKRQEDGSFITAGTRSKVAAALYFISGGRVPCHGEGARFSWSGTKLTEKEIERLGLGGDAWAPSGATQVGGHLYVSRIVHSNVREVEVLGQERH